MKNIKYTFKYDFYDSLAIAPGYLSLLQGQNIKRDVAVKLKNRRKKEEKQVKNESVLYYYNNMIELPEELIFYILTFLNFKNKIS